MKKKIIFWLCVLFVTGSFTSCETLFKKCKLCKTVTYDTTNNTIINQTDEVEYCGTDLIKKEATPPVVIGNLKTVVECR